MKAQGIAVKQKDKTIYQIQLPADVLTDEETFQIDRWSPSHQEGYQRELNVEHIRNIAKYIKGEDSNTNVLPTSIILNSRKPLAVNQLDNGFVEIQDLPSPIFVVDGQHRIAALKMLENEDGPQISEYSMNITLMNVPLQEEMQHFRKVNTTANRAPRGLNQQIRGHLSEKYGVALSPDERAEDRAVQIITRLGTDSESVWNDRISLGGQRKHWTRHTTTQSSIAGSLRPLFVLGQFSNADQDINQVYRIIFDFWQATAEVFPEAFQKPSNYAIQRQLGFHSLHRVLNQILLVNSHPSKEALVAALESMAARMAMTSEFWRTRMGGQMSELYLRYGTVRAFRALADEMWHNIDKNLLKDHVEV